MINHNAKGKIKVVLRELKAWHAKLGALPNRMTTINNTWKKDLSRYKTGCLSSD